MSEEQKDATPTEVKKPECMNKYKHKFHWIWEDGIWTDYVSCINCGEVRQGKSVIHKGLAEVPEDMTFPKETKE